MTSQLINIHVAPRFKVTFSVNLKSYIDFLFCSLIQILN